MNWELLLPNGQVLWNHIVNNWYYFAQNWWDTFSVSFMACTLAASFGFILALVSLRWPLIDIFIGPIIAISQSFPLQALAPIIVIIAGSGTFTRILVAFIITFFPIYGSLSNALREIPDNVTAFLKVCRKCDFSQGTLCLTKNNIWIEGWFHFKCCRHSGSRVHSTPGRLGQSTPNSTINLRY
jgi:ABC-type nitrate/sulfonate/bicarbonate transport system permease component